MHIPVNKLHYVVSAWPFLHWGIDIIGALPLALGRRKYAIIATDYFTKREEAEAVLGVLEVRLTFR